MNSKTIGDYFNYTMKFDCCFWTTYTIDFSTVNFLLHQHIKPRMRTPHIHLMVDVRELEKASNELGGLKKYATLSNKAIFSSTYTPVAFHPKIIFLGSETDICMLVTSGNATPTGVLSNTDLIAQFEVLQNSEESQINRGVVAEIYRFLLSFPTWNKIAKSTLEKLATYHPWLNTEINQNVFTTQKGSLFPQIKGRIKNKIVSEIEIFCPSFDPDLETVQTFKKSWPNAKINVWVGSRSLALNRGVSLKKLQNLGINIYSTNGLNKSSFHAKAYHFRETNGDSLLFWGSANCSRAALISTNASYEILLAKETTNEEVERIFHKSKNQVFLNDDQTTLYEKGYLENPSDKIFITSADIIEGSVTIQCTQDHAHRALITCIGSMGEESLIANLQMTNSREYRTVTELKFTPFSIELIDVSDKVISNRMVINQIEKVFGQPSLSVEQRTLAVKKNDTESLKIIEQLFIFESELNGIKNIKKITAKNKIDNAWLLPTPAIRGRWQSPYLHSIGTHALENRKLDTSNDDIAPIEENKKNTVAQKNELEDLFNDRLHALKKILTKNSKKLFAEEYQFKPNIDQWSEGLEHSIHFTLDLLKQNILLIRDHDVDFLGELTHVISRQIVLIMNDKSFDKLDISDKLTCIRIDSFFELIELNIFLCQLDLEIYLEFNSVTDLQESYPESVRRAKYSLFLRDNFISILQKFSYQPTSRVNAIIEDFIFPRILTKKAVSNAIKIMKLPAGNFASLPIDLFAAGSGFLHPKIGPCYIYKNLGEQIECLTLLSYEQSKKLVVRVLRN